MSYARNLLSRGEEVVYESRQHWFAVIARTWFWLLIAIVALALVIFLVSGTEPFVNETVDQIVTLAAVAGLLAAAGWVGFVLWDWRNQEWLITTRRVIRAEGVLNKSVSDSSLEKINDARLDQSVFGRIFGFGTLDILTAAEEMNQGSNVADFPMIADPVDFKKAMFDQKQMIENPDLARPRYQRSEAPPSMQRAEPMPPRAGPDRVSVHADDAVPATPSPAPAAPPPANEPRSAADELGVTLERLAGLRDKGLITPEEYEAKKRDLLERM
ncbi:MAG TPA: PH domain-containing protein [Candidatus Limnocylindria bacterium]|nr:PH domain-containing protein [Candidatus Limnocylindria bacterium]